MPTTVIPAGYRLTISSWENDADYRKDVVIEGIESKDRVKFIVALMKLFKSGSNDSKCFGNMYEPSEAEIAQAVAAVFRVLVKHQHALDEDEASILRNEDEDAVQDFVSDMLSFYLGSSDLYWSRVFSRIKIEHIPTEIVLEDVTGEFV